jgi:hypothetical protein
MTNQIVTINIPDRKIQKLIEKSGQKGIKRATIALWKTIKTSIRKQSGKQKKYELNVYYPEGGKAITNSKHVPVKEYNAKPNRVMENIVMRDTKRNVTQLKETEIRKFNKTSKPGQLPFSHKTIKKGWKDYWLRDSIQFDAEKGLVYLNPDRRGKNKKLPQLIEMGGNTRSNRTQLVGYARHVIEFKNGKKNVAYTRVYQKSGKNYHATARPFMLPNLKKAMPYIAKCVQEEIKKQMR